jgi:hypothetical protein
VQKPYEAPTVTTLGTVQELTQQNPDKCGGSGDILAPQILDPRFGTPNC